ncbi:hypothetical protein LCGC14_2238570, partial [marine sediment metagenome]
FQYLLKLRAHYTPQMLQAIEQLFGKESNSEKEFNWQDMVMKMSRTTTEEKIEIGTRHRQESNLAPIDAKLVEED